MSLGSSPRSLLVWFSFAGALSLAAQTPTPTPPGVTTPLTPAGFEQKCRQIRQKSDSGLPHLTDPLLAAVLDTRTSGFLQTQLPNDATFEQIDDMTTGFQSLLTVYGSKAGQYPAETAQILRARMTFLVSLAQAFSGWAHKAPAALTQAPAFNQRRAELHTDMNNGMLLLAQLVGGQAAERGVSVDMRRAVAELLIETYPKAKMMTDPSIVTGLREAAISDPDETVQTTLRKVFGS